VRDGEGAEAYGIRIDKAHPSGLTISGSIN